MIEGTNPSSLLISEEEFIEYAQELKGPVSMDSVLDNLKKRRENLLRGGVNCIPLPFKRFRSEVPGIEKGQYVIVTANEKTGKTQYASYVYLYNALDYAFNHPDQCSVHIIYFALEESIQKIKERYMSHLLYCLDEIRITPTDLRSTATDCPVSQEILELLESPKYKERLDFFDRCVQFETENTNPTGILRVCESYMKSVGKYQSHKMMSNGDSFKEIEVFDSYEQYDPKHYVIGILDHVGLTDKEQGFKTKDTMDKMSEYAAKYLRNRYGMTFIAIQQQAMESQGLEAIKMKRMLPSVATLGDSKYTARDADLVIGLFDPSKFGLPTWLGYKIQDGDNTGLKSYARFAYVLANRNGEMGGICPLFFDGATCTFEELPKPEDINMLNTYYSKVSDFKNYRQQRKLSSLIMFLFKKLINTHLL